MSIWVALAILGAVPLLCVLGSLIDGSRWVMQWIMQEHRHVHLRFLWNISRLLCTVDSVYVLDTVIAILGCGCYTTLPKSITVAEVMGPVNWMCSRAGRAS